MDRSHLLRAVIVLTALALATSACSSGGSTPTGGNNVSSATVTVTLSGVADPNQAVVESTGFTAGSPGTPTGVLAQQATNGSGQTTFSGIFISGPYCFTATAGARQASSCYNGNVPASLTLAL
jgi:hypothetical protein